MDMRAAIYARARAKEQDDAIQLAEIEEYVAVEMAAVDLERQNQR